MFAGDQQPVTFKPHMFGNFDTFRCPRSLLFEMTKTKKKKSSITSTTACTTGSGSKEKEPLFVSAAQAEMNRGIQYEADLIKQLRVQFGDEKVIDCNVMARKQEQISGDRNRNTVLLDCMRHTARSQVGTVYYLDQLELFPTESLKTHLCAQQPMNFTVMKPDVTILEHVVNPNQSSTERKKSFVSITVVDIKSSSHMKRSHQMQIAFYAMAMERVLRESSLSEKEGIEFIFVENGEVWLPKNRESLTASPELKKNGIDGLRNAETFPLTEARRLVEDFFVRFMPLLLQPRRGRDIEDVPWFLSGGSERPCHRCASVDACKNDALRFHDAAMWLGFSSPFHAQQQQQGQPSTELENVLSGVPIHPPSRGDGNSASPSLEQVTATAPAAGASSSSFPHLRYVAESQLNVITAATREGGHAVKAVPLHFNGLVPAMHEGRIHRKFVNAEITSIIIACEPGSTPPVLTSAVVIMPGGSTFHFFKTWNEFSKFLLDPAVQHVCVWDKDQQSLFKRLLFYHEIAVKSQVGATTTTTSSGSAAPGHLFRKFFDGVDARIAEAWDTSSPMSRRLCHATSTNVDLRSERIDGDRVLVVKDAASAAFAMSVPWTVATFLETFKGLCPDEADSSVGVSTFLNHSSVDDYVRQDLSQSVTTHSQLVCAGLLSIVRAVLRKVKECGARSYPVQMRQQQQQNRDAADPNNNDPPLHSLVSSAEAYEAKVSKQWASRMANFQSSVAAESCFLSQKYRAAGALRLILEPPTTRSSFSEHKGSHQHKNSFSPSWEGFEAVGSVKRFRVLPPPDVSQQWRNYSLGEREWNREVHARLSSETAFTESELLSLYQRAVNGEVTPSFSSSSSENGGQQQDEGRGGVSDGASTPPLEPPSAANTNSRTTNTQQHHDRQTDNKKEIEKRFVNSVTAKSDKGFFTGGKYIFGREDQYDKKGADRLVPFDDFDDLFFYPTIAFAMSIWAKKNNVETKEVLGHCCSLGDLLCCSISPNADELHIYVYFSRKGQVAYFTKGRIMLMASRATNCNLFKTINTLESISHTASGDRTPAATTTPLLLHSLGLTRRDSFTGSGLYNFICDPEYIKRSLPETDFVKLGKSQFNFFRSVATQQLSVLWGPPGTGKTQTLAWLLRLITSGANPDAGKAIVLVVAFTHKALQELMDKLKNVGGSADRQLRAAEGVFKTDSSGTKFRCQNGNIVVFSTVWNAFNKFSDGVSLSRGRGYRKQMFNCVIIDEASQMPVSDALIASLCLDPRTLSPGGEAGGCRVVLAGDMLQLEPIFPECAQRSVVAHASRESSLLLTGSILEAVLFDENGMRYDPLSMQHDNIDSLERGETKPNNGSNQELPCCVTQLQESFRCTSTILCQFVGRLYPSFSRGPIREQLEDGTIREVPLPPEKPKIVKPLELVLLRASNSITAAETRRDEILCLAELLLEAMQTAKRVGVVTPHRRQREDVKRLLPMLGKRAQQELSRKAAVPATGTSQGATRITPQEGAAGGRDRPRSNNNNNKFRREGENVVQATEEFASNAFEEESIESRMGDLDLASNDEQDPHTRPAEVVVGTVETMQGAEFDVVIVALATVKPSFTYHLNRLNVALSRARDRVVVISTTTVLHPPDSMLLQLAQAATTTVSNSSTAGSLNGGRSEQKEGGSGVIRDMRAAVLHLQAFEKLARSREGWVRENYVPQNTLNIAV